MIFFFINVILKLNIMAPQTPIDIPKQPDNTPVRTFSIHTFDDGNQKYEQYRNEWIVTDLDNRGKCSLKNVYNGIEIKSISAWKIKDFNDIQ